METIDMTTSHVTLITEANSTNCATIAELSKAIAESLSLGQDQVACIIKSPSSSRVSNLSFTYCRNGSMHETYGSRPVLDFGLVLSRIHWDNKKPKLIDRIACNIKGCKATHTSETEAFCIRCYSTEDDYFFDNVLRRTYGNAKYYFYHHLRRIQSKLGIHESPF
jgi:hypothetical protein